MNKKIVKHKGLSINPSHLRSNSDTLSRKQSTSKKHKKNENSPKKVELSKNAKKAFKSKACIKAHHRRAVSEQIDLTQLQGNFRHKAPKIFKNQIFTDVYDELGNHDRVLDTIESLEMYHETSDNNLVTFMNKSEISTEKFIQPDLSYKSVDKTNDLIKPELFEKLEKIAKKKEISVKELIKPLTFQRHQFVKKANFSFKKIV